MNREEKEKFIVNGNSYQFEAQVGNGSFGEVWQAIDEATSQRVAIKFVPITPELDGDIEKEVSILKTLKNEKHIINLIAFTKTIKEEGEVAVFVLELGISSLADFIKGLKEKKLEINFNDLKDMISQMLQALAEAHAKNILHLDIKPDNFVLTPSGLWKLIDFNLSKVLPEGEKVISIYHAQGTLAFAAPEAVKKAEDDTFHVGARTDIWSLGAILYSFMYGISPTEPIQNFQDLVAFFQSKDPIEFPNVSPEWADVQRIAKKCLNINPEKRPMANELLMDPFFNVESLLPN